MITITVINPIEEYWLFKTIFMHRKHGSDTSTLIITRKDDKNTSPYD